MLLKDNMQRSFIYPRYVYSTSASEAGHLNNRNKYFKLKITMLRILTGRRQTSWLFYKRGRGVELGSTVKQLQLVVRAGLEPGTSGFQLQSL